MSDDNVTWEPIPPGDAVDYDMSIGPDNELRVVTELGEMVVEFDDAIRLCRAVAPQWRQEPPDEEGDWWLWRESDSHPRYLRVYADPHHPEDWTVGGAGQMPYSISRTEPIAHYWWLPATVPTPPRT